MSPLPGYQVNIVPTPPSAAEFNDISTLFVVGQAVNAGFDLVYSIDQFESIFGARQAGSPLWDGLQVAFREGLYRAYVSAVAMTGLDADLVTAMQEFTPDLGPGHLAAFGHTTATVQQALAAATQEGLRIALLDGIDTPTAATLLTQAATITGQTGDEWSAMFAPWDEVPGITPGTARTVPPTARIAGNIARNDAQGRSPGDPAAGVLGMARYVQGLSQVAFSDTDRTNLNGAGVNISRVVQNGVRTYGFRTLTSQTSNPDWSYLNSNRTIMAIKADLSIIAENFEFSKLDGAGTVTKKFAGALAGGLDPYYRSGDLYGGTPQEAYSVDVGPAVNTDATFAAGKLGANVGIRTSDMAEQVIINIAKVPITEALAS